MQDLSNRVYWITQALRALQLELKSAQFQLSNPGGQDSILDDLLTIGLVEDLRSVVDHMRYFLWCYIESVAANPNTEIDYRRQNRRLRETTEMLRLLRFSFDSSKAPQSLLDEVTLVVNRHLDAGISTDVFPRDRRWPHAEQSADHPKGERV